MMLGNSILLKMKNKKIGRRNSKNKIEKKTTIFLYTNNI